MLKKYVSSSLILIVVTTLALVVANSPLGPAYRAFWDEPVAFSIGGINLFSHDGHPMSLMAFINDFLMAIFFFSVGLEIKREMLVGELSSVRKAMLPIIGACGGMLVPVLVFYFTCPDDPLMLRGCAIPMATDIAFSLGVLAIFHTRCPSGLKVFLAALAVADDLGGIIVIALFYSSHLHVQYLLYALLWSIVLLVGNLRGVMSKIFYICVGILVWYSLLNSGIHATIAGVVVAFMVPARPRSTALQFVQHIKNKISLFPLDHAVVNKNGVAVLSNEQIYILKNIEHASDRIISPLQDLEDSLKNPINFFVIPVFAFANAGIFLQDVSVQGLLTGVGLPVFLGLAIGKIAGVFSFSWLAVKLGFVNLPEHSDWKSFVSVCMLTGIGFTVSIFIADLSYHSLGDEGITMLNDAKLGILLGSIVAGIVGWALLKHNLPKIGGDYTKV